MAGGALGGVRDARKERKYDAQAGLPALCLVSAMPSLAMAQDQLDNDPTVEMQKQFAEAYNRGDVDAIAAALTENAVRVTPSGRAQMQFGECSRMP